MSCGVDCLQTIYDNYHLETDPDYRLNCLFNFNCGWHGDYGKEETYSLFIERAKKNKLAADALNLPLLLVDSNLHAFLPNLGDQSSYFNLYTCAFALEKGLSKYYISSSYSYGDVLRIGHRSRNLDFSEYGDPLALPLMRSEKLELIIDGCQYERTEKTERIADWEITKKYLNVCCINDGTENCSVCPKCVRTLLTLEAINKLDEYKNIFKIENYKKISYINKCRIVLVGRKGKDGFSTDIYSFYKKKGKKLPSWIEARLYSLPRSAINRIKRIVLR